MSYWTWFYYIWCEIQLHPYKWSILDTKRWTIYCHTIWHRNFLKTIKRIITEGLFFPLNQHILKPFKHLLYLVKQSNVFQLIIIYLYIQTLGLPTQTHFFSLFTNLLKQQTSHISTMKVLSLVNFLLIFKCKAI